MKISLPWPDARLSPNARVHYRTKSAATKKARILAAKTVMESVQSEAALLYQARQNFAGDFGIPVMVVFYPPDNRKRDTDNAIASCKAYFDGIADALAINDSRFVPTFRMEAADKPGRCEVLL